MREIPLTQGKVALVDDEDYERVVVTNWCAVKSEGGIWYALSAITTNGRRIYPLLHRFILNAPAGRKVDHKNRDGLDCRRENLRFATTSQNAMNMRRSRSSSSPFKGVSFVNRSLSKPWRAQIKINGKAIHLHLHTTAEGAARAYDAKAKELFGEFARLNFPEEGTEIQ